MAAEDSLESEFLLVGDTETPGAASGPVDSSPTDNDRSRTIKAVTLPPQASKSGRRYYVFLTRHRVAAPCVVAGSALALEILGGSWVGHGTAPRGFSTWEEASLHLLSIQPQLDSVVTRCR